MQLTQVRVNANSLEPHKSSGLRRTPDSLKISGANPFRCGSLQSRSSVGDFIHRRSINPGHRLGSTGALLGVNVIHLAGIVVVTLRLLAVVIPIQPRGHLLAAFRLLGSSLFLTGTIGYRLVIIVFQHRSVKILVRAHAHACHVIFEDFRGSSLVDHTVNSLPRILGVMVVVKWISHTKFLSPSGNKALGTLCIAVSCRCKMRGIVQIACVCDWVTAVRKRIALTCKTPALRSADIALVYCLFSLMQGFQGKFIIVSLNNLRLENLSEIVRSKREAHVIRERNAVTIRGTLDNPASRELLYIFAGKLGDDLLSCMHLLDEFTRIASGLGDIQI